MMRRRLRSCKLSWVHCHLRHGPVRETNLEYGRSNSVHHLVDHLLCILGCDYRRGGRKPKVQHSWGHERVILGVRVELHLALALCSDFCRTRNTSRRLSSCLGLKLCHSRCCCCGRRSFGLRDVVLVLHLWFRPGRGSRGLRERTVAFAGGFQGGWRGFMLPILSAPGIGLTFGGPAVLFGVRPGLAILCGGGPGGLLGL